MCIRDRSTSIQLAHCSSQQDAGLGALSPKKECFLVEWTNPDDPDHPHNWSNLKKGFIMFEILFLTCVTYMGSSIYTPGQQAIQSQFKVRNVVATLNLSIYVLGYRMGPIFLAPFSEFATIGRQTIYIITLFVFIMFQIGCATVENIGGLIVMRFISGVLYHLHCPLAL